MAEDIPEDIQRQLSEIERQARVMGESEGRILTQRPTVLQRLLAQREDEMGALRSSESTASKVQAEAFARRTDSQMRFHPETGKPLDKTQDEE